MRWLALSLSFVAFATGVAAVEPVPREACYECTDDECTLEEVDQTGFSLCTETTYFGPGEPFTRCRLEGVVCTRISSEPHDGDCQDGALMVDSLQPAVVTPNGLPALRWAPPSRLLDTTG